jgi:hypothetical protein
MTASDSTDSPGDRSAPDPIVLASDHRGANLKEELRKRLVEAGHDVRDLGTQGADSVDYPDYAASAARAVSAGEAARTSIPRLLPSVMFSLVM